MKKSEEKIKEVLGDPRLQKEQAALLAEWVSHNNATGILDKLYTLREYGLFISKPYEKAIPSDLEGYCLHKREALASPTGNRVILVRSSSISLYIGRIRGFYRWLANTKGFLEVNDLAYVQPKIIKKQEVSKEELCKRRAQALLANEPMKKEKSTLSKQNLETLKSFHNYKISSGKVESYTGFVGKLCFLRRLGLFLDKEHKTYKEASREDIQNFINELQVRKTKVDSTYKAHLLDFYRYVYGMFGEEQPRIYPEVVSWLYQKRKKSHDRLPKEIIPDNELKAMIERCSEARDKALLSLMADCSGRVGEIINTCIKDLKINEVGSSSTYKHLIATVTLRGKTGERTNQLFYSVPYLRLWLMNHPLKENPNAPLFIATKECRYGLRLTAVGVNKILQRAARRANCKRHIHAHLFRHTNITRMARILSESELKIHAGWGAESDMATVYVHLSEKDVASKILEKYGIKQEQHEKEPALFEAQICPNTTCSYQNPGEAKFCLKCGYPLTLNTAISLAKLREKEETLHSEIMNKGISTAATAMPASADIKELMYQVLKSDPALIAKLKEIVGIAERL